MLVTKFFKPKRRSGFKKNISTKLNVINMLRNAPRNWGRDRKLHLILKQANALANVTTDTETEKKARMVVREASRRIKKLKQL